MDREKMLKQQLLWTKIGALACVGILVVTLLCSLLLVPQILQAVDTINDISTQLAAVDWATLAANLDTLVTTSTESLSALDIEQLNRAVEDLRAVIAPLVKLFGN